MPRVTLQHLPGSLRLAVGCFAVLVLGFLLLAELNLFVHVGEGAGPPSPREVLVKYHGDPDRTLLEQVLDPSLPYSDPHNMSQFLGGYQEDEVTQANRKRIFDWIAAGAPESGWADVAPIFTAVETCGGCHVEGGEKKDLPFQTYEQVLVVVRKGEPPPLGPLMITAHNHLFAFAVLALLLSVGLCLSRVRGTPRAVLILAASGGALLDVGGWFLTRAFGAPFQYAILLGGGLFGIACTLMALALLRDVVAGPRAGDAGASPGAHAAG